MCSRLNQSFFANKCQGLHYALIFCPPHSHSCSLPRVCVHCSVRPPCVPVLLGSVPLGGVLSVGCSQGDVRGIWETGWVDVRDVCECVSERVRERGCVCVCVCLRVVGVIARVWVIGNMRTVGTHAVKCYWLALCLLCVCVCVASGVCVCVCVAHGRSPLAQMEEERREHVAKMKKMEMEMEQVFEMKVKEKIQKLKDSEAEVRSYTRLLWLGGSRLLWQVCHKPVS